MAEADDLCHFNELRLKYIYNIAQNIGEARTLMIKLNSNLQVWTERTGELEHLAKVWAAFQNRLACVSAVLGAVEEDRTETGVVSATSSDAQSGPGAEDG